MLMRECFFVSSVGWKTRNKLCLLSIRGSIVGSVVVVAAVVESHGVVAEKYILQHIKHNLIMMFVHFQKFIFCL